MVQCISLLPLLGAELSTDVTVVIILLVNLCLFVKQMANIPVKLLSADVCNSYIYIFLTKNNNYFF